MRVLIPVCDFVACKKCPVVNSLFYKSHSDFEFNQIHLGKQNFKEINQTEYSAINFLQLKNIALNE